MPPLYEAQCTKDDCREKGVQREVFSTRNADVGERVTSTCGACKERLLRVWSANRVSSIIPGGSRDTSRETAATGRNEHCDHFGESRETGGTEWHDAGCKTTEAAVADGRAQVVGQLAIVNNETGEITPLITKVKLTSEH